MKTLVGGLVLAVFIAGISIQGFTAWASTSAKVSDQVCMERRSQDREKGDKTVMIVVSKQSDALMKARGFKRTSCKGDTSHREEYNEEICKFAAITPFDVQADFKRVYGATPAELCEATK